MSNFYKQVKAKWKYFSL